LPVFHLVIRLAMNPDDVELVSREREFAEFAAKTIA